MFHLQKSFHSKNLWSSVKNLNKMCNIPFLKVNSCTKPGFQLTIIFMFLIDHCFTLNSFLVPQHWRIHLYPDLELKIQHCKSCSLRKSADIAMVVSTNNSVILNPLSPDHDLNNGREK